MLKMRGLLAAVVVLAALAGLLYWSQKSGQTDSSKTDGPAGTKVLAVPEAQVTKLELRRADGSLVIERKNGKWAFADPAAPPADQSAVFALASSFSALTADRLIDEKATDFAQYGLTKPSLTVAFTEKNGKTRELLFGDEAPTGSGSYARIQGDPRVFTLASVVRTNFDKTVKDLRDKRLLTFDSSGLTRVELAAKGQDIEFGKNAQNEWQILKPQPLRADGGQVEELVVRLQEAKMDLDADPQAAEKAFGSAAKVAVAKVTDASGTQQLEVRRDKDQTFYARSSAVAGVYKIAAESGTAVDKGLDDFRNHKVFDFGWSDPSKLEIHDGAKVTVFEKSGEKWKTAAGPMDTASVQMVVDKVRDLSSAKFPEKGFTTGTLEITVTSNSGKRVEKASFAKVGDGWIAKRDNEPSLYEVTAAQIDELQKAIAAVKPPAPAKKK